MTATKIQDVLVNNEDRVSLITLNLPEKRNAVTPGIMGGLIQALNNAEADDEIRCVVITGADPAFCGGGNVSGFVNQFQAEAQTFRPETKEPHYSTPLRTLTKPIIAAVNGPATGAGFQLCLMCDIRIASEKARFAAAYIRFGLDAGGGVSYFLSRSIGLSNAFYMIYSGEMIDAKTALEWKLVTKVVPHEELIPATMDLAKKIAQFPSLPLYMNRRTIYHSLNSSFENIFEWQQANRMICSHTKEHFEASKAFLEKRGPGYKVR